jgi:hypothetical protein
MICHANDIETITVTPNEKRMKYNEPFWKGEIFLLLATPTSLQ